MNLQDNHERIAANLNAMTDVLRQLMDRDCIIENAELDTFCVGKPRIRIAAEDFFRVFSGQSVIVSRSNTATHYYSEMGGVRVSAIELVPPATECTEVLPAREPEPCPN